MKNFHSRRLALIWGMVFVLCLVFLTTGYGLQCLEAKIALGGIVLCGLTAVYALFQMKRSPLTSIDIPAKDTFEPSKKATMKTTYHFNQQGQRPYQEDSCLADDALGLYIVCDGVGGAAKGNVASKFVVDTIADLVQTGQYKPTDEAVTKALVNETHRRMLLRLATHPEETGMGTTLTLLYVHENGATIAHVGDSRVYYIRPEQQTYWRTKDHSMVQELATAGVIKESDMKTHPMRNRITKAIQAKENIDICSPDCLILPSWQAGDLFFLCSDGVLEPYGEDEHVALLGKDSPDYQGVMQEISSKCAAESRDNNTAILIQMTEDGPSDAGYLPALVYRSFS
jgi:serine/threonine protein phosphatase PrpC